jgi:hypothetical protein
MSNQSPKHVPSDPRPVDSALHPIETGNYRLGTPAIEEFFTLIETCLKYRITGALIYGPPRIGKTRAIEYLRLLMAERYKKITTYHVQAEHKPRHAEGPFFASLLEAVGFPNPDRGSNPAKRINLSNKIKEACSRNGSSVVVMFIDEAQRLDENEYEWLRDVHDHLDRMQIRMFTFLVGQQEILGVKTAFVAAKRIQIVARLMVEELPFYGVRDVDSVATCLAGYDETCYPKTSSWSFTRFYLPKSVASGYTLASDANRLWKAFEHLHHKHGLAGPLEIPMESFARAVEIVLKEGELRDQPGYRPGQAMWNMAATKCGYIQSRQAVAPGAGTVRVE